ncbi:MAG: hypothetical protein RQ753_01585 [Desulfurivibrionaceae bacterium]|nr:hypothetical protein [Desulfurivibrionaceae bacterium]
MRRNKKRILFLLLLGLSGVFLLGKPLLSGIGEFLVDETKPLQKADAAVVLTTGVDYTARLIEAAQIYNKELVDKIVINGDRKSKVLQGLEEKGYREECHWSVNPVSVLNFFDVPTKDIVIIPLCQDRCRLEYKIVC